MDERDFLDFIMEAFELSNESDVEYENEPRIANYNTFEDAGLMTRNKGIVVRLKDGSEFQLTVVQSKYPEE